MQIVYCGLEMSRVALSCAFIGFVAMGCATKKNPALMCPDGQCTNPKFPFCDSDGAVGGEPNTCIAVSCTAGAFVACDQDRSITCNSDGTNYDVTQCPNGCSADTNGCRPCAPGSMTCGNGEVDVCDNTGMPHAESCAGACVDSPSPHCEYIQPRYLPDVCDTPGVGTFEINQSGTFDTDLDVNCTGGIVTQAGGDAICVVRNASIKIDADATFHVISSLNRNVSANMFGKGRAIAFVSDQDLVVDGVLDVGAQGWFSGPGGGYSQSGGGAGSGTAPGGAGFATNGGAGGSTTTDGGAANGGAATLDPATLVTLVGGPRSGGGGGGAALLISCRGKIVVTGTIGANGGGGPGGWNLFTMTPGSGGGAGGYVVLQGLDVQVTGELYANGGGGGAGANGTGGSTAEDGQDGSWSGNTSAFGGTPRNGAGGGGVGGLDGAAGHLPGVGLHPTTGGGAGGGGGSVGFLQTYTPAGVTPTLTPAHSSPHFRPNATIPTR
jgi:hypothetical protein